MLRQHAGGVKAQMQESCTGAEKHCGFSRVLTDSGRKYMSARNLMIANQYQCEERPRGSLAPGVRLEMLKMSLQELPLARKQSKRDARKWQRIPLAIPVFIRGMDTEGKEFLEFATALNISAGGALVATRRQLPRCARLSLEIPVAPVPRAITLPKSVRRLKAKLVRVTLAETYQLWGLKFANILDPGEKPKSARIKRKVTSFV